MMQRVGLAAGGRNGLDRWQDVGGKDFLVAFWLIPKKDAENRETVIWFLSSLHSSQFVDYGTGTGANSVRRARLGHAKRQTGQGFAAISQSEQVFP
jgi:hypothetical protein